MANQLDQVSATIWDINNQCNQDMDSKCKCNQGMDSNNMATDEHEYQIRFKIIIF